MKGMKYYVSQKNLLASETLNCLCAVLLAAVGSNYASPEQLICT